MRFTDGGEGTFGANAGLPTVAVGLLSEITAKYCPHFIGIADLWVLAANVAIKCMGGPMVKTRFGRVDAKSSKDSVEGQEGRLPPGDASPQTLRDIFCPKGFNDRDIVALSGAHTVGACHLDRSGFDGPWTETPQTFDVSYFKNLLEKKYSDMTTSKGEKQGWNEETKTMMLVSDLSLLEDEVFIQHVKEYAGDNDLWLKDFTAAWIKLQENGCDNLRENL